ncbi:MAG: recombinase family protein [Bacteroidetes bacterium]|nr:recombinase family protein [Bacteroidota bacterium]
MKKGIIYARVSTLTQRENETIEMQVKKLKKYATDKNLKIVEIIKDDGISGAKEGRAINLIRFIENLERKPDFILIKSLDRLSRDTYLQLWIEKELKKYGVEMILAEQENLQGDDPFVKVMRTIMGAFAELDKEMIIRRLKNGRKYKLENGIKASGTAPIGYAYKGKTAKEKRIVVDKNEAEIVKMIFELYIKNRSLKKVKNILESNKIYNRKGLNFSRQSLALILKNKFYIGKIIDTGKIIDAQHKPIIDLKTFKEVKRILKLNRRINADRNTMSSV